MKFGEASKIVLEALRANVESESLSLVKSVSIHSIMNLLCEYLMQMLSIGFTNID